ncbi:MAG: thioredoxin [Actinomycetota bacterium]|nr:thioredoxin [Actinomycetota bacterium]
MSRVVSCPACGRKNRVPPAASGTPRCGQCRAPLPWLTDADEANFEAVAEDSRLPVLVDLWAPWCGPCRTVGPAVEQLAAELAGRLKVVKVNVDEAPGISSRYGVQGIPTLLILRDGKVASRQVGALPAADLRAWVEQSLAAVG